MTNLKYVYDGHSGVGTPICLIVTDFPLITFFPIILVLSDNHLPVSGDNISLQLQFLYAPVSDSFIPAFKACNDTDAKCPSWALLKLCKSRDNMTWMNKNCRKSCGLCKGESCYGTSRMFWNPLAR